MGAIAALVTAAPFAPVHAQDSPAAQAYEPRLSYDDFRAMVAEPVRLLESGDISGAEAAFERLLRRQAAQHGPESVAVAEHLEAFGLALFMQAEPEQLRDDYRLRSLAYFRRAIPAYRAAYGPDHLETALTIGTYADAALRIAPDDPPQDLDALLEEAHRIRAAALGPGSIDAAATLLQLAKVRGAPSRTRGDPARIAAAADAFRRVARLLETVWGEGSTEPYSALFALAEMYVRNGRPADALAIVGEIGGRVRAAGADPLICMQVGMLAGGLRELLTERGQHAEATELSRIAFEGEDGCFGVELAPFFAPEPR